MKLIKSYLIQTIGIGMSIFMLSFFVFSFLFMESDKYEIMVASFSLGILFYIISSSRIEYDEHQI